MHLHSLLLLSQPSRLPVTVTKPCRIYILVTFDVHQHQTCNSHYNPQLVEIERKQCLKKTYTNVKSYLLKKKKRERDSFIWLRFAVFQTPWTLTRLDSRTATRLTSVPYTNWTFVPYNSIRKTKTRSMEMTTASNMQLHLFKNFCEFLSPRLSNLTLRPVMTFSSSVYTSWDTSMTGRKQGVCSTSVFGQLVLVWLWIPRT